MFCPAYGHLQTETVHLAALTNFLFFFLQDLTTDQILCKSHISLKDILDHIITVHQKSNSNSQG